MSNPIELSDEELRLELKQLGFDSGPVSASTRSVMEKKLLKLRKSPATPSQVRPGRSSVIASPASTPSRTPSRSPGRPRKSIAKSGDSFTLPAADISPPLNSTQRSPSSRRNVSRTSSTSSRQSARSAIPSPVSIAKAEQSDNELDSSPRVSTFKRTPTPPRPTLSAQRAFNTNNFTSTRNIVPGKPISTRRNYSEAADEDDDSMESSRILSSSERSGFGIRRKGVNTPSVPLHRNQKANNSPVEIVKRFGTTAAQYIQDKVPRLSYVKHESERGKYGTPGGRLSPLRAREAVSVASPSEVPKWLVMIFGSFTVVLAMAYVFTAHSKTITRTNRLIALSISDTVNFIYNYAIFPVLMLIILVGIAFVTFFVYKKRKIARETAERRTMELVDKIADRVRDAGDSGIAEQHLRDTLLPPTRRSSLDMEIWNSAVSFINNMDSRMRSESRLIKGVECNVWIWVNSQDVSRGWQGVAERSSPKPNYTPSKALTRCLKLRGIADNSSNFDGEIKKEIYSQLRPIVPTHFAINHAPNEHCVYMMFSELSDAKTAFDAFHTHWFRGSLVSVKYVKDERYNERFPETLGY